MSEAVLTALIGLFSGIGGALITLVIARQRNRIEQPKLQADARLAGAQAADQIGEAALALLQPYKLEVETLRKDLTLMQSYKSEVETLRSEVRILRGEIDDLRAELSELVCEREVIVSGAHQLYHQIVSMGATPIYKPPDRRGEVKP